ncbi:MAG: LuxR C-terminal-related transcriptional regulator [Spirochaetota bacterium]
MRVRASQLQMRFGFLGCAFFLLRAGDEIWNSGPGIDALAWAFVTMAAFMFVGCWSPDLRPFHAIALVAIILLQSWLDPRGFTALCCALVAVLHFFRGGFFLRRARLRAILLALALGGLIILPAIAALGSTLRLLLPALTAASVVVVVSLVVAEGRVLGAFSPKKGRLSLRAEGLSFRERMFAQELLGGMLLKQIAYEHQITESTVHNTLANAYKKLGVRDSHELRALGVKYQIME